MPTKYPHQLRKVSPSRVSWCYACGVLIVDGKVHYPEGVDTSESMSVITVEDDRGCKAPPEVIARLVKKCRDSLSEGGFDLESNELDDMVHDLASSQGSDANNGDLEGQIEFLLHNGYSEEELEKRLAELSAEADRSP